jgi:hypothetical protein
MAVVQKNNACENFYKSYVELTETKKNAFSKLCNKLLSENFIYAAKQDDKNDYYDLLSMKSMVENYFSILDYDLIHVDSYKVFYIQTNADRNRIKLRKVETVIALVFRLLYYKGSLDINSNSDIVTTLGKLLNEINKTGIFKTQISQTECLNALKMLRRYKLINYSFNDFKEDNIITIYPTILFVVKVENINMLNDKLKAYLNVKEEESDEIDED